MDDEGIDTEGSEPKSVFRFFDLPRELRNACYESIVEDEEELYYADDSYQRLVLTIGIPSMTQQRVCRQFRSEILEQASESGTIEINFRPHICQEIRLPPVVIQCARHLVFRFFLYCREDEHHRHPSACNVEHALHGFAQMSRNPLAIVGTLTNLETLDLNLYLNPHRYDFECKRNLLEYQALILDVIPAQPCVTNICVHEYQDHDKRNADDLVFHIYRPSSLIMQYDSDEGHIKVLE